MTPKSRCTLETERAINKDACHVASTSLQTWVISIRGFKVWLLTKRAREIVSEANDTCDAWKVWRKISMFRIPRSFIRIVGNRVTEKKAITTWGKSVHRHEEDIGMRNTTCSRILFHWCLVFKACTFTWCKNRMREKHWLLDLFITNKYPNLATDSLLIPNPTDKETGKHKPKVEKEHF